MYKDYIHFSKLNLKLAINERELTTLICHHVNSHCTRKLGMFKVCNVFPIAMVVNDSLGSNPATISFNITAASWLCAQNYSEGFCCSGRRRVVK